MIRGCSVRGWEAIILFGIRGKTVVKGGEKEGEEKRENYTF